MSMVKTPVEIDEEALAPAPEVPGTKPSKHMVGAALHELGRRLSRILVKLGEMADKSDFDEVNGTKPRFCTVCRPHLQLTKIRRHPACGPAPQADRPRQ
jgi:hypothetical protein